MLRAAARKNIEYTYRDDFENLGSYDNREEFEQELLRGMTDRMKLEGWKGEGGGKYSPSLPTGGNFTKRQTEMHQFKIKELIFEWQQAHKKEEARLVNRLKMKREEQKKLATEQLIMLGEAMNKNAQYFYRKDFANVGMYGQGGVSAGVVEKSGRGHGR